MLKSAGKRKLECPANTMIVSKSVLALGLLAMLAGNQAVADINGNGNFNNATDTTQIIIDDSAAGGGNGNSVSIDAASPQIVLDGGATGSGTTVIGTGTSSFSGSVTASSVTANSVTAQLDAASAVISNVSAGVAGTDAVNLNQLNAMQSTSSASLSSFASDVDSRFSAVDRRIDKVEERAYGGIASVAALAAIPAPAAGKRFSVGAGLGNYSSESAVAIGIRAAITESTSVTAGVSTNTASKTAANMGVGYSW